jgi:hypothetical protein
MKEKVPSVGKFIDKEEEALHTMIESDRLALGPNPLASTRLKILRKSTTQERYVLAELLLASDYSQPLSPDEQDWVSEIAMGREIL